MRCVNDPCSAKLVPISELIHSSSDFIFDFIENHWRLFDDLTTGNTFYEREKFTMNSRCKMRMSAIRVWHTYIKAINASILQYAIKASCKSSIMCLNDLWLHCDFLSLNLFPSIVIHDFCILSVKQKVFNCFAYRLKWTMNAKMFAANSEITLIPYTTCSVFSVQSVQSVHRNHWMGRNQLNT